MNNSQIQPVRVSVRPGRMSKLSEKIEKEYFNKNVTFLKEIQDSFGIKMRDTMDTGSLIPTILPGSISVPAQFLQYWEPGIVKILTRGRRADDLTTYKAAGAWHDEEVVQKYIETTGQPAAYADFSDMPLASYTPNYETRTIVRFKLGLQVGQLETARSSAAQIDTAGWKREACADDLEVLRNLIAFYGFNGGVNRTYGFLNDPFLPAYLPAFPKLAGGTTWAVATFDEILRDIRFMKSNLRVQSGDNFDFLNSPMILAVGTSVYEAISTTTSLGYPVINWIRDTMPNIKIVSVPELDAAVGGLNAAYLYFESVPQLGSTDDGSVIDQLVPAKYLMLGSRQDITYFAEGYSMATAGVSVKRPICIVRMSGV